MIAVYPASASLEPGQPLVLHVSTDGPRFRVHFYRWGDGLHRLHRSDWLPGRAAAPSRPHVDWHWPAYAFALPPGWPSAIYIAQCEQELAAFEPLTVSTLAPAMGAALFVLCGTVHAASGDRRGALPYKPPMAACHDDDDSAGFYHLQLRSPRRPCPVRAAARPQPSIPCRHTWRQGRATPIVGGAHACG